MLQTSNSQFALTKNTVLKIYRKVYRFCGNSVKTVSASFEYLPFTLMQHTLNVLYSPPPPLSLSLSFLLYFKSLDIVNCFLFIVRCVVHIVYRPRWQFLAISPSFSLFQSSLFFLVFFFSSRSVTLVQFFSIHLEPILFISMKKRRQLFTQMSHRKFTSVDANSE